MCLRYFLLIAFAFCFAVVVFGLDYFLKNELKSSKSWNRIKVKIQGPKVKAYQAISWMAFALCLGFRSIILTDVNSMIINLEIQSYVTRKAKDAT